MITPLEIQNKEFKKVMRGYKESEVDEFLDKIIVDYEKLYKDNMEFKDKIALLHEQLEKYENLEKTLNNTLIVAQTTAEEVSANAKKNAEIIIKEAEVEGKKIIDDANEVSVNAKKNAEMIIREADEAARKIIDDANKEVIKVHREYEEIKKQMHIFKTRFKTLLEAELEAVAAGCRDIFQDDEEQL